MVAGDGGASLLDRFRLDGAVALVTGAGKGIGAAIARGFAEAGAGVALVARTASDLDAVAATVRDAGGRALVLPCDVSDVGALAGLVERTVAELGGLDIVVNNAGGSVPRPFVDTTVDQLESSFRFNVAVPFELVRLALPHLLAGGRGAVVNIGSMAGANASRGSLVHGTTKAALGHLTRLMAADLAPRVRVNAVLPGAVETDSLRFYLDKIVPGARDHMAARTLMRRNGTPEDIAAAVLYLVSPAAAWVTGKLLEVDGAAGPDLIEKDLPDL